MIWVQGEAYTDNIKPNFVSKKSWGMLINPFLLAFVHDLSNDDRIMAKNDQGWSSSLRQRNETKILTRMTRRYSPYSRFLCQGRIGMMSTDVNWSTRGFSCPRDGEAS